MEDIFEYKDCISPIKKIQSINVYGVNKETEHIPQFTIAIPTFKRVSTLCDTIESSLLQKDFEDYNIIVVDNNPERNDETEKFMQQYLTHPKVSYFKNSVNLGMAGNWNKCLLLSSSNNVILLHDDDVISPYCLKIFDVIRKSLTDDWAMVKPNLKKFTYKRNLSFSNPQYIYKNKLHRYSFYNECAVGAPTCILLNRHIILEKGGYNQMFYPSMDYVMTCRTIMTNSIYSLLTDSPIGGYRIACNESLSPATMNAYFDKRYTIGKQIMSLNRWNLLIIKIFQSLCYKDDIDEICNSYNMKSFSLDMNSLDIYPLPYFVCRSFRWIYRKSLQVLKRLEREKIDYDLQ